MKNGTPEKDAPVFTVSDVGCWADGALGHDHVRETLADLIDKIGGYPDLVEELRGKPSEIFSEETDALDILTENSEEWLHWHILEGDLMLIEEDEV